LAASGSSALPTAKVAPSTSAAVIVMATWTPSRLIVRVCVEGFPGSITTKGADVPRTSRQSYFGLQALSVNMRKSANVNLKQGAGKEAVEEGVFIPAWYQEAGTKLNALVKS
jgi:hypothetical protein